MTNIAPQATKDQMQTLFGYLGKIDDIRLYPTIRDVSCPVQSRICYVKYYDSLTVGVALHLTNTVFIDRALIVIPVQTGEIPDEHKALEMSSNGTLVPGLNTSEPRLPPNVINTLEGVPPNQVIQTHDPRLPASGLPNYPPLPAAYDSRKIEEIRRTLLVVDIPSSVSSQQLIDHFCNAGEVKYMRFCDRDTDKLKYSLIEFSEQESILKALKLHGTYLDGHVIKIHHATQAISKPQTKSNEAAQREIEEAMCRVKEAQNLISAAIDPVIGMLSKDKRRTRSRSRSRRRSRSKSRSRSSRHHRSRRSRSRHRSRRSRSRSSHRSSRSHRSRSGSHRRSSRSKRDSSRDKDKERERDKGKDSEKKSESSKERSKESSKEGSKTPAKELPKEEERRKSTSMEKEDNQKSESDKKESEAVSDKKRSSSRDKKRSRSRDRKKSRDRSRDRHRSRSRSRRQSKDRKQRSRSRDRKRSRSRTRKKSHSRDRKLSSSRDRRLTRSRDRKRSKSRERKRSRSRDKKRDRSRSRDRSKRSRSRDRSKRSHSKSLSKRESKTSIESGKSREKTPKLLSVREEREKSVEKDRHVDQSPPPFPEINDDKNSPDNMDISNSP